MLRSSDLDGSRTPSAEPELGTIALHDVAITAARRWVDAEGTYVVESTEFDLYGEGGSFDEALSDFAGHLNDYLGYIAELAESEDATDNELRVGVRLATQLARAHESRKRVLEERGLIEMLYQKAVRSRRQRGQQLSIIWHPTPPTTTSQLLPA